MDAFALESHRRAAENTDNGLFAGEIVPVPIKDADGRATGELLDRRRGHPAATRRWRRWPALARPRRGIRRPAAPDITAGNASQMTDGAAAMLIADRADGRAARACRSGPAFAHFAVAAEDPVLVLSAPNPVTRKLLERTGMKIDEFDAIECNEAFAAIALMWAEGVPARRRPRGSTPAAAPSPSATRSARAASG